MRNRKLNKIVAAVLVACSVVGGSGAVSLSQNETYSFEWKKTYSKHGYPLYNGNRLYFFSAPGKIKFTKLPKSNGGRYINEAYASDKKQRYAVLKREMKRLGKARKRNAYHNLMEYDYQIVRDSYQAKFGLKGIGCTLSEAERRLEILNQDFYTIEELNYAKKKGYIKKYSLYYGAEQLKNKQISVGETLVNRPSNMPKSDYIYHKGELDDYSPSLFAGSWVDPEVIYHLGQEWSVETPVYKDGKIVSKKKGSDVVSVDKKTGKVTGLKKGKAIITVEYAELCSTEYIPNYWTELWKEEHGKDGLLLSDEGDRYRWMTLEMCVAEDKKAKKDFEECRKADLVFTRSYVVTVK